MKKLAAVLVAIAVAAPAVAAQGVAPAVKRKPPTASKAPAAPAPAPAASASAPAAPAAAPGSPPTGTATPQQVARTTNEREVQATLTAAAAQGGADPALDTSLIRVMSRLVVAGRCREAAGLASRDGRKELAFKAQQLCR